MALKTEIMTKKSIQVEYVQKTRKSSGVVIVPKNLDVSLDVNAKK